METENNNKDLQSESLDPPSPVETPEITETAPSGKDIPQTEATRTEEEIADFHKETTTPPPSRKSPNKKLPLIIAAVVILVAGIAFGIPGIKNYMLTKDPVNHILYAFMETSKESSYSSTTILTGRVNQDSPEAVNSFSNMSTNPESFVEYINTLAGNFQLRIDSNAKYDDKDLFVSDMKARLRYNDKNFLTINGGFRPWALVLQSEDLYSKPLVFDMNRIIKEEAGIDLNEIDMPGYLKIVTEKDEAYNNLSNNKQAYYDVIHKRLTDKLEKLPNSTIPVYQGDKEDKVSVYNYKVNLTLDELYSLYADVLEVVKTDEKSKAFALDRYDKVVAKMIADKDYEQLHAMTVEPMTEEEFKEITASLRQDIDARFGETVDQSISQLREMEEQLKDMSEQMKYDMTLSIDKKHRLRQYTMNFDADPMILSQVVTYNAFGSAVKVTPVEIPADAVDLYEISNQPEPPKAMIKEMADNLTSKVLSGEAMEAFLKDAQDKKEILPENERDAIANGISESVDQLKGSIGFMLMMMGIQ